MKIEKLELKHLAGYLPYGLIWDYVGLELLEMNGISKETVWTDKGVYNWTKHPDFPTALTPILRPLRLLTEEIIHEGEKIVPMVELSKIIGLQLDGYSFDNVESHCEVYTWGDCFGYDLKDRFFYYIQYDDINYVKNQDKLWQKMYELKFDINDLIGSGLALDSTTVGNPYDK